jgi:hypothetical protein
MSTRTHSTRRKGWLYTVLSVLVMTAQLVVAIAPLSEWRDGRTVSHVETGGTQTHHAHNEASCAACQARSIHGSTPREPMPLFDVEAPHIQFVGAFDRAISRESHSPANPRAPPSLI